MQRAARPPRSFARFSNSKSNFFSGGPILVLKRNVKRSCGLQTYTFTKNINMFASKSLGPCWAILAVLERSWAVEEEEEEQEEKEEEKKVVEVCSQKHESHATTDDR